MKKVYFCEDCDMEVEGNMLEAFNEFKKNNPESKEKNIRLVCDDCTSKYEDKRN